MALYADRARRHENGVTGLALGTHKFFFLQELPVREITEGSFFH
jgi:hypothetical protein